VLNPEKTHERILLLQRLRELMADQIQQEITDQKQFLTLLAEKNQATIERLARSRVP